MNAAGGCSSGLQAAVRGLAVVRAVLGANKIGAQSPSSLADPADASCRHARHQREVWNLAGYNCTSGNEAEFAEGMTTDDSGVSTDRGAAFDERPGKLALTLDGSARVANVGEHA